MKVQDLFNSPKPVADGSIPSASTKCVSSITANVSALQAEEVGSTPIWRSTQICWAIKPSLRLRLQAFLTVLSKILFKNLGARSQATEVSYQGGTRRYRIIVVQRSLTPLEVERNHLPLPSRISFLLDIVQQLLDKKSLCKNYFKRFNSLTMSSYMPI